MNGISLWREKPIICGCGGTSRIGGNGAKEASFFYDTLHGEYVCPFCGEIRVDSLEEE